MERKEIYKTLCKILWNFGIFPCKYNERNNEIVYGNHSRHYYFYVLNFLFIIIATIKQLVLVVFTHIDFLNGEISPVNYEIRLKIRVAWFFGVCAIYPIYFTQSYSPIRWTNCLNRWIKLVENLEEFQPLRRTKSNIFWRKAHVIYLFNICMNSIFLIGVAYIWRPTLPPFLYSIGHKFLDTSTVWASIVKFILGIQEVYLIFFLWANCNMHDLILIHLFYDVYLYLKSFNEVLNDRWTPVDHEYKVLNFYRQIEILFNGMPPTFTLGICLLQIIGSLIIPFAIHGFLTHLSQFSLFIFFFSNAIGITLRLLLLFMPMGKVYKKSIYYIEEGKGRTGYGNVNKKLAHSLKPIVVKCGQFYNMSYSTILQYFLFVTNYSLIVMNSWS